MRYLEIINEGRDADLYRGIRELDHAISALDRNEMLGTTTHRFWADGKRRKDNDPEYEGSFWMKGISTTREINFAKSWGDVLFILDQTKLSQQYKIIPFNYGYSIPTNSNGHKGEREEFVLSKKCYDDYMLQDKNTGKPTFNTKQFIQPAGSIKPLSRFLKGIMLIDDYAENGRWLSDANRSKVSQIISHPKFIGYYDVDKARKAL